MRKFTLLAASAAVAGLMAAPAWAQGTPSAKATFTYGVLNVVEEAFITDDGADGIGADDIAASKYDILNASIKMPKHKELLINVSLECGNFLDTQVKSKGGDRNVSTADATVRVMVLVDDGSGVWKPALPSGNDDRADLGLTTVGGGIGTEGVVFCHRSQTLEAKFQGIIQQGDPVTVYELTVENSLTTGGGAGVDDGLAGTLWEDLATCQAAGDADGLSDDTSNTCADSGIAAVGTCLFQVEDGSIFLDTECLTPEEVRLTTASLTANSFVFMYPNTERSGVHNIKVVAWLDAGAGLSGDAPNGLSRAKALIGLGAMSVQTVRMIKGDITKSSASCTDGCPELD